MIEATSHRRKPSAVSEFGESPALWKSLDEDWKIPSTKYWIRDSILPVSMKSASLEDCPLFYETFY